MAEALLPRTPESISDLLFQEMRAIKPITIMRTDLATGEVYSDDNTNKYDYEADTYVNRLTFGDFSNSDPDIRKPVFRLDCNDFSAELKLNLVERVKAGKQSIHRVVERAVYRLIRAMHETAFFDHIKDQRLNWRFV